MNRDELKKKGIIRFFRSFKYSMEGLIYAFAHEQNMFVHIVIGTLIVILGMVLKLNLYEWLLIGIVIGLVVATELINTSIEAVVDLACPKIHPLAKIAKDTAAASVFVFACTAVVVGLFIFIPNLLEILEVLWDKN